MKKLTILIGLLFIVSTSFAQMGKVRSAYASYQGGNLQKAKKLIDEATIHSKSQDELLTWVFRGEIYISIITYNSSGVGILDAEALPKAIEAYVRAKELDKLDEYPDQINSGFVAVAAAKYNLAIKEYNEKIYDKAGDLFSEAHKYADMGNRIDTNSIYNSAISFNLADSPAKAEQFYDILIGLNIDNSSLYSEFSDVLFKLEKTDKAFEVIAKGREIYPEDYSLLIAEANLYLNAKQTDKALENLEAALAFKSDNYTIYHTIGVMYNNIFADTVRVEAERFAAFAKSVEAYKNAIDLEPTFFDSVYNLGAIIFNKGAYYLGIADELPFGDKNYDGLKEKGDVCLVDALPYLENALELNPEDKSTLYSLKQIYSRTGANEKYKVVDEKLKELGE